MPFQTYHKKIFARQIFFSASVLYCTQIFEFYVSVCLRVTEKQETRSILVLQQFIEVVHTRDNVVIQNAKTQSVCYVHVLLQYELVHQSETREEGAQTQ